jgi:hypothetical protein
MMLNRRDDDNQIFRAAFPFRSNIANAVRALYDFDS